MSLLRSLLLATVAAVAFFFPYFCTEALVEVPEPIIQVTESGNFTCVPPRTKPPTMDTRKNYTVRCYAARGVVVWTIAGYQMVDRDQFGGIDNGIDVQDATSNNSTLLLYPSGVDFILEQWGQTFNISCQSILNELNVRRTDSAVFFFEGFPDIKPPEMTVTYCHNDSSYTIRLKYEIFNSSNICIENVMSLSYKLTLSHGNCTDEDLNNTGYAWCNVKDTSNLVATLNVSDNKGNIPFSKELSTTLRGVACNQATWGFDRSSATGKEEVAICANFSPYDKGDALEVKIVPSSNISGILVRDVRDDVAIGDTQTATFQADFQCTGNVPPSPTPSGPPDEPDQNNILFVVIGVVLGVVVLILVVVAIVIVAVYCVNKEPSDVEPQNAKPKNKNPSYVEPQNVELRQVAATNPSGSGKHEKFDESS